MLFYKIYLGAVIIMLNNIENNAESNCKNPNFLIIMVDELRYPTVYEDDAIKEWRAKYLKAENFLRNNGVEFNNHYIASTACAPGRTSIYTGQYPSLHGVTQTDGGGDTAFSPDIFWLDPNTVPTFGDYLRTAGYNTFWKGKWHASHSDISIPGTHDSFSSYDDTTGIPNSEKEEIYLDANRLNEYGFDEWVGPEPHGSNPHNSASSSSIGASGRDEAYSSQVINLLKKLEHKDAAENGKSNPWAIVASFVNPHDITLFGAYTRLLPTFNFEIDSSVPHISPAPTAHENLDTKPKVQSSYKEVYPKLMQPLRDSETFRKLYYSLQLKVDQEIQKVLKAIKSSPFYENTIIIFTSDHGDMLGAHGGLFQKWYVAYEEAIHVPFIVHNPKLTPQKKSINILTSHIDILPTILGLANIDSARAIKKIKKDHTEVHPLVGRDLTPLILGEKFNKGNEPVYFMTDDDPSKTLNPANSLISSFEPVTQPSHIETIIVKLPTGENHKLETWKYSRYFDNTQFWTNPGTEDITEEQKCSISTTEDDSCGLCITTIKTSPVSDEIEMYNLSNDPTESKNFANPKFVTPESETVQVILKQILASESRKKRLYPESVEISGKPTFVNFDHLFSNL